jgi:NAD-dependent deacetylase sirtuin 2
MMSLIEKYAFPEFLSSIDLNEPKSRLLDRSKVKLCGAFNRIPEAVRQSILKGNYSIEGVAQYLKSLPHTPKIVVLCGAGISTSAGIKDFRSSNGLYADSSTANIFSMDYLDANPPLFYSHMKNMFLPVHDGYYLSTKSHALLRLFDDMGWLRRVYTQNIDMLEHKVLTNPDVIVECHGTCRYAICSHLHCGFRINELSAMNELFWDKIRNDCVPTCPQCNTHLRPDVTFFGEPVPERFIINSQLDLPQCDLILVMGTSLVVYPVASLPQMVSEKAVRMLINRDATGCFQHVNPCNASLTQTNNIVPWNTQAYRDVFFQGDCDTAAELFAKALGTEEEFNNIIQLCCTKN